MIWKYPWQHTLCTLFWKNEYRNNEIIKKNVKKSMDFLVQMTQENTWSSTPYIRAKEKNYILPNFLQKLEDVFFGD